MVEAEHRVACPPALSGLLYGGGNASVSQHGGTLLVLLVRMLSLLNPIKTPASPTTVTTQRETSAAQSFCRRERFLNANQPARGTAKKPTEGGCKKLISAFYQPTRGAINQPMAWSPHKVCHFLAIRLPDALRPLCLILNLAL